LYWRPRPTPGCSAIEEEEEDEEGVEGGGGGGGGGMKIVKHVLVGNL
jgi:hypothetical protein